MIPSLPPTTADPPIDPGTARIRSTYVLVLGGIVITAIGSVVALAVTGTTTGAAGAVIGAIGSAAIGALSAMAPKR